MDYATNWWTRPAGFREVLQVALPLVVSSLSWTVMTFVDRMMLNWVSGEAMAAAFSGSVIWFASICLPLGICAYANTFVAQYFGSGNREGVARSTWQAVWIALACTIPCSLLGLAGHALFASAGHDPLIEAHEATYFRYLTLGSGGMLLSQSLSAYFAGQGRTRIVMWVDALFATLNGLLDWLLIFGNLGFPRLEVAGAALATVIALWLKAATWLWLFLRDREGGAIRQHLLWRPDWPLLRRMLGYGGPAGLQMFVDVMGFAGFMLLVNRLGTVPATATALAFNVSSFAFMPVHGFGQAAGILVGQHLGENREGLASRSAWTAIQLGIAYMLVVSLFYIFLPQLFLAGYFAGTADAGEETRAATRAMAVVLLRFVAAYNIFDAAFMVFSGALKGAGDTVFILWTSLSLAGLLTFLTWLSVVRLEAGVYACWTIVTAWVCLAGTLFCLRFVQGRWRDMRVIERDGSQHGE